MSNDNATIPPGSDTELEKVIEILMKHDHVKEVIPFGHVVCYDASEDVSLLIIPTDDQVALKFFSCVECAIRIDVDTPPNTFHKNKRADAASKALLEDIECLLSEIEEMIGICKLNIFIFPADWRNDDSSIVSLLDPVSLEAVRKIAMETNSL